MASKPKKQVRSSEIRRSRYKARKDKLNKWAHGDAKSNVAEYKT